MVRKFIALKQNVLELRLLNYYLFDPYILYSRKKRITGESYSIVVRVYLPSLAAYANYDLGSSNNRGSDFKLY